MNEQDKIEAQIRNVLATETGSIAFSEKLFSRDGLFSLLAHNREEREALVQTPLFQEAQRRLSDLQEIEMNQWLPKSSTRETRVIVSALDAQVAKQSN